MKDFHTANTTDAFGGALHKLMLVYANYLNISNGINGTILNGTDVLLTLVKTVTQTTHVPSPLNDEFTALQNSTLSSGTLQQITDYVSKAVKAFMELLAYSHFNGVCSTPVQVKVINATHYKLCNVSDIGC